MTESSIAYAKINMSIDIVSKMPDGYHSMRMVMQTVSLYDEINIECEPGKGVSADPGMPYLPGDERNIAVKAALVFFEHTGIEGYRTHLTIKKNIPVCAGLGGGSADGAAVLRALNTMFATGLGRETLETLAGNVGSDVPFCVTGGTSLAEGRGDILTDVTPIPPCHIVICKPPFTCSTPELFKRIRCEKIHARPDTEGIVASLDKGDLSGIARRMYNVFEDVLPRGTRDIADIKYILLDNGALGAAMTGTGPTVFGLFESETGAREAYDRLKRDYKESYLATTMERLEVS